MWLRVKTLADSGTRSLRSLIYKPSGNAYRTETAKKPSRYIGMTTTAKNPTTPVAKTIEFQYSGRTFNDRLSLSTQLQLDAHMKNNTKTRLNRHKLR